MVWNYSYKSFTSEFPTDATVATLKFSISKWKGKTIWPFQTVFWVSNMLIYLRSMCTMCWISEWCMLFHNWVSNFKDFIFYYLCILDSTPLSTMWLANIFFQHFSLIFFMFSNSFWIFVLQRAENEALYAIFCTFGCIQ